MARRMVSQFGMNDTLGQVNFGDNESQPFLGYSISQGRNYSDQTAFLIDQEVRKIIDTMYHRTVSLLRANQDKLNALAQALQDNEVIDQTDIARILGIDAETDNASAILRPGQ
jgi:cell division protease FtsH